MGEDQQHPDKYKEVFQSIYLNNTWKDNQSRSGPGSNLEQTAFLRKALPQLLKDIKAQSLLDIPCGDFFWMQHMSLPVQNYIGADIVDEIILANQRKYKAPNRDFVVLDIATSHLPNVDVVFSRDCLQHLSNAVVRKALKNIFRSRSKYLLMTTFTEDRNPTDIRNGDWRPIRFQDPPFGLPDPLLLLTEGCTERDGEFADKSLGLWPIENLRHFYDSSPD